jgi:hypothetical protein
MSENWSYVTTFGENFHVEQIMKVYKTLQQSTYNHMKNSLNYRAFT